MGEAGVQWEPGRMNQRALLIARLNDTNERLGKLEELPRISHSGFEPDSDAATETMNQMDNARERERLLSQGRQIVRAIGRVDSGCYGTCNACSRPIGAARLKALPDAGLCVGCASRREACVTRSRHSAGRSDESLED